jgi:hypothetical protein
MKLNDKEENLNRSQIHRDYLLELAIDWDCINTAKEYLVQDTLEKIYVRRISLLKNLVDFCLE